MKLKLFMYRFLVNMDTVGTTHCIQTIIIHKL